MSSNWTAADLPSLEGTTAVVTGASSGIGLIAARELARAGSRVILAVRDVAKGERVAATFTGTREVRRLDLTDLASVREFADGWAGDIDVLVNNAGIMAVPEGRTTDGFELQIGTNHLGHFALTNLLLPHVTGRVVSVASGAHRIPKGLDLTDLNWERRSYDRWKAYGQSKLSNLLFIKELQRRLEAAGSDVIAVAAHPGYSATHLQFNTGSRLQNGLMGVGNRIMAQPDAMGALPTLYAATQDVAGGDYVGPDGFMEMRGHPTLVERSKAAQDDDNARTLWELSERMTGVSWPLAVPAAA